MIEDDGLSQPWSGKVWLNPPYSREKIGLFVDKIISHCRGRLGHGRHRPHEQRHRDTVVRQALSPRPQRLFHEKTYFEILEI
jgi:hypothetical protein